MRIEVLEPEHTEDYDRFLDAHEGSLFYQSSTYKTFLELLLGCEEQYLVARERGRICGALPLTYTGTPQGFVYNSLPYYGSNGGIIADCPHAYEELVLAYNEIASGGTTISATIMSNPFVEQDASGIRHNYTDSRIAQFTNIGIRDHDRDALLARIAPSARRNIAKATREGVTVEIDPSQMDHVRRIHQRNMRTIGVSPKDDGFFDLVLCHFVPGRDFDLYVARKDGIVIAGLLLFYFNRTVEYHTPAVEESFRSTQPLALILITAMTEASRRGFTLWNWGATRSSQIGVYRFKRKWGATERSYCYYTQLNQASILDWPLTRIRDTFPHFFVVPSSALRTGGTGG